MEQYVQMLKNAQNIQKQNVHQPLAFQEINNVNGIQMKVNAEIINVVRELPL